MSVTAYLSAELIKPSHNPVITKGLLTPFS